MPHKSTVAVSTLLQSEKSGNDEVNEVAPAATTNAKSYRSMGPSVSTP